MNKHTSFSQSPIKQALLSAFTILMMVPSGQSHGQEQPQDLAADLEPIRATFALPGAGLDLAGKGGDAGLELALDPGPGQPQGLQPIYGMSEGPLGIMLRQVKS